MTSDDTDALTRQLLREHHNFGLHESQLFLMRQGKVPSLLDNDAHFCLEPTTDGTLRLDTKPHGHGDVHMLLGSLHPSFPSHLSFDLVFVEFFGGGIQSKLVLRSDSSLSTIANGSPFSKTRMLSCSAHWSLH